MGNKRQSVDSVLVKRSGPLQIEAGLSRVRQRSKARLGKGINRRAVEVMLSKLDDQAGEEENLGG
jgi:hypothetical protein